MYNNRGVTSRTRAGLTLAAALVMSVIAGCSTEATDVTELQDQRVADIYPSYQLDTSFVGDTVISPLPVFWSTTCSSLDEATSLQHFMDVLEGRADFPACGGLGNFDITWSSSNPAVSSKVGSPGQHITLDYGVTRAASASIGTARLSFTPSLEVISGVNYAHDIVVLPAPDRLELPDVVTLAVGESKSLTASVRNGTGPRINTGAILWGPPSSIASITATDTTISRKQTDGRIVTTLNNAIIVKGIAQGELLLTVQYKKSRSVLETAAAVSGPVMFEKKVRVVVGTVTPPPATLGMMLDPIAAEYTGPTAGNFYRARLFDAQGNEVSATSDGGVISYSSSDTTAIKIDPTSGLATAKAITTLKTATLTATYTKGGQVVATATSAVTVNAAGAAASQGAVQFSVAGDVRRIKVGQTIQFEVVIRDKNGIKQLPGTITAPATPVSSSSALEITPVASNGGFFYNMTVKSLPSASVLTGIANAVSIKASVTGASATLAMVIYP